MRDVNDTGFKLVLGRSDWRTQFDVDATATDDSSADVVYDTEDRCVTLRPLIDRFPRRVAEPDLSPSDRTSAARDRYGSWYWIDPADPTRIVVRNAGDERVETFWPPESGAELASPESPAAGESGAFRPVDGNASSEPQPLGGLTITTNHRLVVGAKLPNQLLVFDLHAGGPPNRISWYGGEGFAPADATPRPDGGLYLLDEPEDKRPRIWALDRTFRPEGPKEAASSAHTFQPVDTKGRDEEQPSSASSVDPIRLPSGVRPQVIEVLPDDTLLVLSVTDADGEEVSKVYRYRVVDTDLRDNDSSVDLTDLLAPDDPEEVNWSDWRAHDIAFVPRSPDPTEAFRGTLYVVGADGNQAYALRLSGDVEGMTAIPERRYIPLRRFSGKGLVEAESSVYYDLGDRWLPLTAQRRPRFVDYGQIQSAAFDSEIAACTWHRVFLDACFPPETAVRIESRASDHAERLTDQPWQPEPDLYQRSTGSEISYSDAFPSGQEHERRGTWELLLQNAKGRYLQLRLTLEGNGRSAPRLYALRAYFPRFSYLDQYMPDLYQEDEASARFLERFLANAEGMLTDIEGRIATVQVLFDVRTVPDEYVDWLGRWFGTSFDPALDVRRKRLFLKHAVELFNQRGTLAGLARMLSLVLDPCVDESLFTPAGIAAAVGRPGDADERRTRPGGVRLVEQFAARDVPHAALGDATMPEQPVEVRVDQPWTFEDGAGALHHRFRRFLDARRRDSGDEDDSGGKDRVWERTDFPPLLPSTNEETGESDAAQKRRTDWRLFVRRVIDGPYAAIDAGNVKFKTGDAADIVTRRFRAFVQRRYRTVDRLKEKWSTDAFDLPPAASFEDVQLPRELPTGKALQDWMHFVGAVLPIRRAAHRFRVLVPVDPDANVAVQRQRLDIARRVVEKEKPAHTAFEVLPYWTAFRVGVVRTGLDTVLGTGSRYVPLLVGDGALAEEIVGANHPMDVTDRRVTGRDAAGAPRPL